MEEKAPKHVKLKHYTMRLRTLALAVYVLSSVVAGYVHAAGPSSSAQAVPASSLSARRELLNEYCVPCHNDRLRTAGLALDSLDVGQVEIGAEQWEKVFRKLRTGSMPPAGRPRPDASSYEALTTWLEVALDRAAAAHPNPGRPAVHRLNRAEYTNAIRDLLGVEIDGRSLLPADDEEDGFDNMAAVLSVSPTLLDRYMSTARHVSRLAVGDTRVAPVFETYTIPEQLVEDDRTSDDLPFGSRGVAVRHTFPVDGQYVVRIRLRRNLYSNIRGISEAPHLLDIRIDGGRVKQFTVGGAMRGRRPPLSYSGDVTDYDREWLAYSQRADEALEVRVPVRAGTRVVAAAFDRKPSEPEGVWQPPLPISSFGYAVDEMQDGYPAVATIAIGGPYDAAGASDTPSRRRVFVCQPTSDRLEDERRCAGTIFATLARRAYRRPVTSGDVEALLSSYDSGRRDTTFEAGIQVALQRLLMDPEFLFRVVRDPHGVSPGSAYRLTDLELASRLSFFLWSSIPDDELLTAADQGRLSDTTVLRQQVRRMLADSRATALVSNFAAQWLQLRKLRSSVPDPVAYPHFDENLRRAFQQETELFVKSQLREDRPVADLLAADYTFVNERLARHYGIPDVYGTHFRRVTLNDSRRGGLLGHGSILTVTSHSTKTSPVLRGKWILENILGAPPPPPPPNVPSLAERGEDGNPRSAREQLQKHRENPACAVCHSVMDPLGFALENFDAVGGWRTMETGIVATAGAGGTSSLFHAPIDASGSLPDGSTFEGLEGLRDLLLTRQDEFASTVAEKLLTYAVGRRLEHYDGPAVRRIVRQSAAGENRWSSVILAIVESAPFQMRRSPP